jgi:hypothetical protein
MRQAESCNLFDLDADQMRKQLLHGITVAVRQDHVYGFAAERAGATALRGRHALYVVFSGRASARSR